MVTQIYGCYGDWLTGTRFNIKTVSRYWSSFIKIIWSRAHLISVMRIPVLSIWHIYIEKAHSQMSSCDVTMVRVKHVTSLSNSHQAICSTTLQIDRRRCAISWSYIGMSRIQWGREMGCFCECELWYMFWFCLVLYVLSYFIGTRYNGNWHQTGLHIQKALAVKPFLI